MLNVMLTIETEFAAKSTVDDTVIMDIAKGDSLAFHTLYESVSGGVYGFALSITKNTHDAEDVLQETFLTIHSRAAEYKPQGKPMAWIFTIARNHALMKLRAGKRENLFGEKIFEDAEAISEIEKLEQKITLASFLNELGDDERTVVMLHAAGVKNREIASVLGVPLNTVLSKYHRAIKKLSRSVEKEGLQL